MSYNNSMTAATTMLASEGLIQENIRALLQDGIAAPLVVETKTLSAPPGGTAGRVWIVGASPTGAWAGYANYLAQYMSSAWSFYMPYTGQVVVLKDALAQVQWNGAAWTSYPFAILSKNKFINGDMRIDQRNSGAVQTFTAAAAIAYCVDRFYASCTGANVTGQRVAGTAPYEYAYKITGLAANTGTLFGQRIESHNAIDLVNQLVPCQAQISSSALTSVTWTAYYASVVDNFTTKTQIGTGTLTINSTPTIYNFSFNGGANAGNGICVEFTTGALVAAQTITYSGVQGERNIFQSPYEFMSHGQQLALCQRYLPMVSLAIGQQIGMGLCTLTTGGIAFVAFPVTPRVVPTGVTVSAAASFSYLNAAGTGVVGSALTFNNASPVGGALNFTVAAGLIAGNATIAYANAAASIQWLGCEL